MRSAYCQPAQYVLRYGDWPVNFEEENVLQDDANHQLLQLFKTKMYNISRIMDCAVAGDADVGKIADYGLGLLRILYSPQRDDVLHSLHRHIS